MLRFGIRLQLFADIQPIDFGQQQVEHDQVGRLVRASLRAYSPEPTQVT